MIALNQVDKFYETSSEKVHAIKSASLSIAKGQHVVIVGKSGSGKSTLLNLMSGIDRPSSGDIVVNGQHLSNLKENELALWRGHNIGIVFQFYQLLPTLSALDNILFAMNLVNKVKKKDRRSLGLSYLDAVGLKEKASKFPNELSGGERQRVAIARSIANNPEIIIADEPTGNLDSQTGDQINSLFEELNEKGTTILTVTHANISGKEFDQVIEIEDGVLRAVKNEIVL